MSTPRESAKVRAICRLLDRRGAWYVKTTGVGLAGCPDLLVCYRGFFLALEVKREHDGAYGVTVKQAYELERIRRAFGEAYVVVGTDEVVPILNALDVDAASMTC